MNGKKAKHLRKLAEGKAIRPGRIVIVAESAICTGAVCFSTRPVR